jgi:methylaspartate mutase epsilon subunit
MASSFTAHLHRAERAGRLVVQPRMGYAELARMRRGLEAVRDCDAHAVGTITLDSYTRTGDDLAARRSLARGEELNGFPLTAHDSTAVRDLLADLAGAGLPVQVRHGTALPHRLAAHMAAIGVDATEGGPVSYCLPYGHVPLADSVADWSRGCELLAELPTQPHLESFGGCLLGQLCPPSLLVALSVLEGLFFREHGLRDISLSYAQQVHPGQDLEALGALRRLATEVLGPPSPALDWHVVFYTYMGVFPRTALGAYRLLESSARLAVRGEAARLVVKTAAEAHRLPTLQENVDALEFADSVATDERVRRPARRTAVTGTGVYDEARVLVESTLAQGRTVGAALVAAFARGALDVPYCLHPDNADRARGRLDAHGLLRWADCGAMPLRPAAGSEPAAVTARGLLDMLGTAAHRFDGEERTGGLLRRAS